MMSKKRYKTVGYFKNRHALLCIIIAVFLLLLLGRLGYLQLLNHPRLEHAADQRSLRLLVTHPLRSTITDRHGHPLAVSVSDYSVTADPILVLQQDPTLSHSHWDYLAHALSLPISDIKTKLAKNSHRHFLTLAKRIDYNTAIYINKLHLIGISTLVDSSRYYPMRDAASNLIGMVGIDQQGLEGIEKGFNEILQGKPGHRIYRKDRYGRVISLMEDEPVQQTPTLHLSIDRYLQFSLYVHLRDGVIYNKAQSGTAILLDINTGEILAMASYPSYNPNNFQHTSPKAMRNIAISDSFEPGSTVKPFVIMAGLQQHLIHKNSVIDTQPYSVNSHLITDVGYSRQLTVTGILQKSSNVGVSHIALAMPIHTLLDIYHHFGFGGLTDSGLIGENQGYFPLHRTHWSDIERATFAFGYGLRITPLQMARAYAAIGALGIIRPVSITRVTPPVLGTQIMSKAVVRTVLHMMESDTLPGGTGVAAAVPGYRLAVKTGTTEKIGTSTKYNGGYINYTAGVAPVSHPRVALVVMIDHPNAGKHFGGSVAAPTFSQIMGETLRHMNISPDALPPQRTIHLNAITH